MTRATIGDRPLLASGPVTWTLSPGVHPSMATLEVMPGHETELVAQKNVDLMIQGPTKLLVEKLSVLGELPSGNPNTRRVLVADRRYWWKYSHVARRYNWRRQVGVKRLEMSGTPQVAEIAPLADDIAFARFSLYPPDAPPDSQVRLWTATEILVDVLKAVVGSPVTDYVVSGKFDPMPVEHLELNDTGDMALLRVLAYFPGAAITVRPDGIVEVYNQTSGAEGDIKDNLALVPGGNTRLISKRNIRPKRIDVLFTREVEVRFDYLEIGSKSSTDTDPMVRPEQRYMDNVLSVPDYELDGDKIAQGTWITIKEALSKWGNPARLLGKGLGTLDFATIQRAFVPFMDLWGPLGLSGAKEPHANWVARVGALQAHYRQTFRIRRLWMDRILHLRAYRVALLDVATGTFGPAIAYAQTSRLYTMRSLWIEQSDAQNKDGILNYTIPSSTYPTGSGDPPGITSDDVPAPCHVSVVDEEQGIVRMDFVGDVYGIRETIFPGFVEMEDSPYSNGKPTKPGPTDDFASIRNGGCITFNAMIRGQKTPKLSGDYKCCLIITAIPAAPNDHHQFECVEVEPKDVKGLFPQGSKINLDGGCDGPVMTVHVPAAIETARIPWVDERKVDIEKLFGVRPGIANTKNLVMNRTGVSGVGRGRVNGASLEHVARAIAARIWATMADRREGSIMVSMDPELHLDGWIESIQHTLQPDGATVSTINLPEGEIPELPLYSLMDAGTRATIQRLARPGKD